MIEFLEVEKHFTDGVAALKRVSAKIEAGEFIAILGPSGSGKTTLLRTTNGLVPVTDGNVRVDGIDVIPVNFKTVRRMVGMIFQQFNLVGNLSVMNNVLAGSLAIHQSLFSGFYLFPKATRLKALEVLDRVGLLDKAYCRTDHLSGGQQQRVGIARALMQKPKVILADEPIASLDPIIAHDILSLLKDVGSENNITVLCSLHQVDFALQFSNRIIGLSNGSIVIDEPTHTVTTNYIRKIYGAHDPGTFPSSGPRFGMDKGLITWSDYR